MTTLLKVTVDNIGAIAFYEASGFKIIGTEEGRKRMLHIMERSSHTKDAPVTEPVAPQQQLSIEESVVMTKPYLAQNGRLIL